MPEKRKHGGGRPTIRTAKTRARFLEALAATCNVSKACRLSRVARNSVYDWRDHDPVFAAQWAEALDRGGEVLEDEAVRRAKDGLRKPVYQGGKLVGHVREYSDTLLIFLLKGAKPNKYGERVEHRGKLALTVNVLDEILGDDDPQHSS